MPFQYYVALFDCTFQRPNPPLQSVMGNFHFHFSFEFANLEYLQAGFNYALICLFVCISKYCMCDVDLKHEDNAAMQEGSFQINRSSCCCCYFCIAIYIFKRLKNPAEFLETKETQGTGQLNVWNFGMDGVLSQSRFFIKRKPKLFKKSDFRRTEKEELKVGKTETLLYDKTFKQ